MFRNNYTAGSASDGLSHKIMAVKTVSGNGDKDFSFFDGARINGNTAKSVMKTFYQQFSFNRLYYIRKNKIILRARAFFFFPIASFPGGKRNRGRDFYPSIQCPGYPK